MKGLDGAVSVLGSSRKCQKSKVHKISDRFGISKKFPTPKKNIFFFGRKAKFRKIFKKVDFWGKFPKCHHFK